MKTEMMSNVKPFPPATGYLLWGGKTGYRATAIAFMERQGIGWVLNNNNEYYSLKELRMVVGVKTISEEEVGVSISDLSIILDTAEKWLDDQESGHEEGVYDDPPNPELRKIINRNKLK